MLYLLFLKKGVGPEEENYELQQDLSKRRR